MAKRIAFAFLLVSVLAGCPSDREAQKTLQGTSHQVDVAPAMRAAPPPANATITRLRGPESVLHDAEQDVYFISNLNGGLQDVDNNGFITRVDAKSLFVTLKWVEGGRGGVRLDAPKGMGIVGDTLYVSDVTAVRRFDRRTGRSLGEVKLPGATLINDITTDGRSAYVSDTGLRVAEGHTFLPTGTDAIWKITDTRAEKIASGRHLRHPNGLDFVDGRVWAVTFGPREVYALRNGKPHTVAQLPRGQLDGLVSLPDHSLVVSSWLGEGVYRGSPGGDFQPILTGIDAPADLGYDAKRNRLLVPIPGANQVTIHALR